MTDPEHPRLEVAEKSKEDSDGAVENVDSHGTRVNSNEGTGTTSSATAEADEGRMPSSSHAASGGDNEASPSGEALNNTAGSRCQAQGETPKSKRAVSATGNLDESSSTMGRDDD